MACVNFLLYVFSDYVFPELFFFKSLPKLPQTHGTLNWINHRLIHEFYLATKAKEDLTFRTDRVAPADRFSAAIAWPREVFSEHASGTGKFEIKRCV